MHTNWDKHFDFYCPIVIAKFSSSTSQKEGEEKEARDDALHIHRVGQTSLPSALLSKIDFGLLGHCIGNITELNKTTLLGSFQSYISKNSISKKECFRR